jgi:DNA polymerase-3 subunit beta
MKLEVTQENLSRALSTVSRVAHAKTSLPILNNILFKAEKNRLVLAATNLEIAITEHVGAKVSREGVITIPARLVGDYVANLPKGTITLSLDGTKLHIETENYKSSLNGVVADEFPALPEIEDATKLVIPASILKRAIQQTILTVSHDETRPILTGIYLHTSEGALYMAGTDGYRLSERRVVESSHEINAIIPAATLQDVVRVLPDDSDEVTLLINDQQAQFLLGDITITSRLIDGKYPDYRQLIPSESETTFTAQKDELNRIVKIASLFARESGGSITITTDQNKSLVSIHSLASQLGENTSELSAQPTSDGAITLNSRYVIEALGVVDASEIMFGFSGKLAPCVVKGIGDDSYIHIIMPLKS